MGEQISLIIIALLDFIPCCIVGLICHCILPNSSQDLNDHLTTTSILVVVQLICSATSTSLKQPVII